MAMRVAKRLIAYLPSTSMSSIVRWLEILRQCVFSDALAHFE
jgi:hypothetical protein